MSSSKIGMDTPISQEHNDHSSVSHYNDHPSILYHTEQQSDYDRLHLQCLAAMNEIESLQKIHAEISCRCERAERDSESYREQYTNIATKHDKLKQEYEEVIKDRDKLRQDYEEIVLLREREKLETSKEKQTPNATTPPPTTTTTVSVTHGDVGKSYSTLDALQKANDDLTYKFDDLKIEYELLCSKYKKLQEDNFKLRDQNDQLSKTNTDYDAMKQRCVFALMGLETALRNRDEMRLQHDTLSVKLEEAKKLRVIMNRNISDLQKEKNSVENEYRLVMSERDSVHQEIAKLQDDLGQTKTKEFELHKEKEKAKEHYQRQVSEMRKSRDKALSDIQELWTRLSKERVQYLDQIKQQRQEIEMMEQQRNAAKKERNEAMAHRDEILKECFEVKQNCTRIQAGETDEMKTIKDQFNKLCFELKAWKTQEVANQIWAFDERDKVIRERDKIIRELEGRKEDFAKLEEEFRLYKEMTKGMSKLHKSLLSKENMLPSQDSAIDTDSLTYHIERIELRRSSDEMEYGFKINGGIDRPVREDTSIFIVDVVADSIADTKLKVNDCILQVNSTDLTNVEYQTAYDALFTGNYHDMKVLRHRQTGIWSPLQRIDIQKTQHKVIGLSIDSGLFIKKIEPGSAAAEEETLSIGDKILTVNGQSLEKMSYEDAKEMLKQGSISLTVLKPSVSTTSSHRSLSHNTEDHITELSLEKTFPFTEVSNTAGVSSSLHYRSPSAPLHTYSDHMLAVHSEPHIKSMSVINRMSDDDIRKMLNELQEEQRRRIQLDIITEGKPHRYDSFVKQGGSSLPIDFLPQHRLPRPVSTHSSKASVTSSCGSNSRYEGSIPSSPLNNISRSDPLALDKAKHFQVFGIANSNNSASTVRKKPYSVVTKSYVTHPPHPRASIQDVPNTPPTAAISALSNVPDDFLSLNLNSSLGNGPSTHHHFSHSKTTHFSSLPNHNQQHTTNADLSDRYTSHSSMSMSKQGSKSCSSHSSLASETLDKMASNSQSHHIQPVDEEVEAPLNLSSAPSNISPPNNSPPLSLITTSRSSSTKQRSLFSIDSSLTIGLPSPDDIAHDEKEKSRHLIFEKGQYPLGITIAEGVIRGIFVSGVTEESIAAKNGMKYGDQLLEYNGINLRGADYNSAVKIIRDSERQNTVRILVQYNPHKMPNETSLSAPSTPSTAQRTLAPISSPPSSKRGGIPRCSSTPGTPVSMHIRLSSNTSSSSDHSKLMYAEKITAIPESDVIEEPRSIHIARKPPSTAIGVGIIGGNNIGIFISDVQKNSLAAQSDLKPGDQILLYNRKDMQKSTLEEATLELGKPTDVADLRVQYNPPGYRKSQTQANDSFFVRAQFDRTSHIKGELSFHKGDILHITETLYKGQLGVWRANIVNENADNEDVNVKPVKGKIPSKGTAEQEILIRRFSSNTDDKSKSRKSLFRRSKKGSSHHAINHSRESSDSKADIESTGASFVFIADEFNTYQYVKQIESVFLRPVIVLGAMAEPVCDKLVIDSSSKFARCFEVMKGCSRSQMQSNVADGTYIDYKIRKGGERYEVILPEVVKNFVHHQTKHCLLDVNAEGEVIDRIVALQLFPIVVFLKYKSPSKIKELKENHYIKEKISTKDAKEMHERFTGIENKFKHLINVTISCTNLNQICKDINDNIDEQQKKRLWVLDE